MMIDPREMPDVLAAGDLSQAELETYLQSHLRRQRADPLNNSYPPSAQQLQFVGSDRSRIIVVAANRVGKTSGAMRDFLWTARGDHPYKQVELHSVMWAGFPDYPSYLRFTKPAFDEWCPRSWIVGEFHETDKYVEIRRKDGGICTCFFLSYDMPRTKWQGAGVDHIWLDEEPPEDIFGECLARLVTTNGSMLLTFTPVEGVGFWYDRIWAPAEKNLNEWLAITAALAEFDPENEAEFNVGQSLVPHLSRQQIVRFASNYPDPDERAIRVFGQIKSRAGLVLKSYSAAVHHCAAFDIPRHWMLWGGLDPGFNGFAAELFTQDDAGTIYRVGEYFSSHESTGERFGGLRAMIERVRPSLPRDETVQPWHPYHGKVVEVEPENVVVFFVDTEDPQVVLELNIEASRLEAGIAFASLDQGMKARKAGILRMQQLMHPVPTRPKPEYVTRPSPAIGEPAFYLCDVPQSEWRDRDRLVRGDRLAWEMERWTWKPPTKVGDERDDANDGSAGGAHALSAGRYGIMARLGPGAPPEVKYEERDDVKHLTPVERMVWKDLERAEQEALDEADGETPWQRW